MDKLNEYKTQSQIDLTKRIDALHSKWTIRIKEYILTLPDGEEKSKLSELVNNIENR